MKRLMMLLIVWVQCNAGLAADLSAYTYKHWVDSNGTIILPADYRSRWTHLGSWIVPEEAAPGKGFHDIYTQPQAAREFLRTGQFADGTVLIKEVRAIHQAVKTTGNAQWAGAITIWFVMIKDRVGRFENNPHWSGGWGWALFEINKANPDGTLSNTSKGFTRSCQGCHLPAKNRDWVFIEGYPTLTRE